MKLETKSDINYKLLLHNRRFMLLSIVLGWGILALVLFVIRPKFANLFEIKAEIDDSRSQLEKLERKLQDLEQLRLSEQFQKKDKVDEVLPSHKPLLELLSNLNQAATQTKVGIQDFKIEPGRIASSSAELGLKPSKQGYRQMELSLSIEGQEENVEQFLELVERIAPLTTIIELNINRHTEQVLTANQRFLETDIGFSQQDVESDQTGDLESETEQRRAETLGSSLQPNQSMITIASAELTMATYYYTQTIKTTLSSRLPSVGKEEVQVFDTIQKFRPTEFKPLSEVEGGELEDLFGVENLLDDVPENPEN